MVMFDGFGLVVASFLRLLSAQDLRRVSFPSLWGFLGQLASRDGSDIIAAAKCVLLARVVMPHDPRMELIATKLALTSSEQLALFPAVTVNR